MKCVNMKKMALILAGVGMVFMLSACPAEKGTTGDQLSDYRPMIYVRDNLYGETADVVGALPEEAAYIGTIKKVVPQNEPMVRENFSSNALPEGSEIYYSESEPDAIYVKLADTSKEQYSKYTAIE